MPRPLRILHPGAWYHITARGIERRPIFLDDRDRLRFLELLEELTSRFALRLHAYVLMDNHYHLLIDLERPNLSRAVQWLNVSYSVWFNRRRQRSGYLFQGRFKSVVVDPPGWGMGMSAYIHLNPVRVAGLGLGKTDRQRSKAGKGELPEQDLIRRRVGLLRAYRWSSYRAYLGLQRRPEWLTSEEVLRLGGGAADQQKAHYRKYVEDQVREGKQCKPWDEIQDQPLLGRAEFLDTVRKAVRQAFPVSSRQPRWLRKTLPLQEVIRAVAKLRGEKWEDFKDRHADSGRDLVLLLARRTTGLTISELTSAMRLVGNINVSMAVKRYEARLHKDKSERALAARAAQMLNAML